MEDNKDYKEVKVTKLTVNGTEYQGNTISAEDTKGLKSIKINIHTEGITKDNNTQTPKA